MGRKAKNGLAYYPLDVDMFSDVKIRRLIRRHGGSAVSTYVCLLCAIYREGYSMPLDEDTAFLISEQSGCSEEDTLRIIEDCVSLGLFDKDIFENKNVLTSEAIQERYVGICAKTKRIITQGEYWLLGNVPSEGKPISSEEMPIKEEEILTMDENHSNNCCHNDDSSEGKEKLDKICLEGKERVPNYEKIPSEEICISSEGKPISSEEMPIKEEEITYKNKSIIYKNKKKISTNVDIKEKGRAFDEVLNLPFSSERFVSTWNLLRLQPKWKKKTQTALQMSLDRLGRYDEGFAISLMEAAISNGWQGVVYENTDSKYEEWKRSACGNSPQLQPAKGRSGYGSSMDEMKIALEKLDDEYYK